MWYSAYRTSVFFAVEERIIIMARLNSALLSDIDSRTSMYERLSDILNEVFEAE